MKDRETPRRRIKEQQTAWISLNENRNGGIIIFGTESKLKKLQTTAQRKGGKKVSVNKSSERNPIPGFLLEKSKLYPFVKY